MGDDEITERLNLRGLVAARPNTSQGYLCMCCHENVSKHEGVELRITQGIVEYLVSVHRHCIDEYLRKARQDAEDHSNIVTGEFSLEHEHDRDTFSVRLVSSCSGTPALRTIIPGETARELAREILAHEAVAGEQEWPDNAAPSGERSES